MNQYFQQNYFQPYHIETSQLIWFANQWNGFYMIETSVMKEYFSSFLKLQKQYVVNKGKGWISKQVQEIKAHQIFPKRTFLPSWYVRVSWGKKCSLSRKFGVFFFFFFFVTLVLRFALLPYCQGKQSFAGVIWIYFNELYV